MTFVKFDDFCLIPGQLEIMWWVKMLRSLVYNLRTRWFLWMKIKTWHTFQNPHMKFPDISLTFAPFQNFPDIFSNSLTIPWPWKNIFFPDFSLTRGNPEAIAWSNDSLTTYASQVVSELIVVIVFFILFMVEILHNPSLSLDQRGSVTLHLSK